MRPSPSPPRRQVTLEYILRPETSSPFYTPFSSRISAKLDAHFSLDNLSFSFLFIFFFIASSFVSFQCRNVTIAIRNRQADLSLSLSLSVRDE